MWIQTMLIIEVIGRLLVDISLKCLVIM
ncbi:hypothetical protein PR048_026718 [Dryococelus australis]|uniref:Uncharacterized protein n=1 Tax=Dryococelus australis TaxID=614101 RepID=A0ABQ9GM51_9NEOP|nr:hypothetical protein PR048_026718 [Dryococelus australis]